VPGPTRPTARRLHLGVVGEGVCSRRAAAMAERIGRGIAAAGAVLLTGGRGGVMEAASRGAAAAGGLVVGVLPGVDRGDANPWVGVPIVTGMDQARNVILVRSCDAIIAVGGMYGTLSEIALALEFGVPVVGLGTWRLAQPEGRRVPVQAARSPEDAVARAVRAAGRFRSTAASVTAIVLMVPGAVLLLLLERVLRAEYQAFFGQVCIEVNTRAGGPPRGAADGRTASGAGCRRRSARSPRGRWGRTRGG
jgi:uncharacterized protein (TIGR00725 family)